MEEFAKIVEIYKWRGSASKHKHEETFSLPDASLVSVTHDTYEQESADSGCTGSQSKTDEANSSPSPSFLQHVGRDVRMKITEDMLNKSLSLSSGHWNRSKKNPQSLQSHPFRQLVFSEEDMGAKGTAKRRVKPKEVNKKGPRKKKKIEINQGRIDSTSQGEGALPDFYSESKCENSAKEFLSPSPPGEQVSVELVTPSEWKGGRARTRKSHTRHASMCGKSPYFMHSKQKAKTNGANKVDDGHISMSRGMSAEMKPHMCRKRKEVAVLNNKADSIEIKPLAGHQVDCSDWEDSGGQSAHVSKQPLTFSDSSSSKSGSGGKKSLYFATVKALGQRDIANKTWVPPVSVHALIQEELYQDPWKVLVACMLLNKTSGKQMRKIIWDLFALCPTPEAAVDVETSKIEEVIWGLGLQKKRARMIQKFSKDYLGKEWSNVGQLHGIGKYATDAYAIFCEGRWQEVEPEDHKLVDYWQYLCATQGLGYAFKDDREKGDDVVQQVSKCGKLNRSQI